ncbi:MAG: hypothetical protein ABFC77_02950 [Thermoguttaceae bacterium]
MASLLVLIALAWCAAGDLWTPAAWQRPARYIESDEYNDVLSTYATMKAVAEGDYLPLAWKNISALGAPHTANWNDWPSIEELPMFFFGMLGKAFGLFAGLHLSLLLGHVLAALTFYLVARCSDCNRTWSLVGGWAYGLAPFLFAQSPHHITVAYAWHIPLFLLVWRWVATEPGLAPRTPRFWWAVGIGFLAGLQNVYYTNILCQLTLLGALALFYRNRSWRALFSAGAVVAAAAFAFTLMNLDTWTYRLEYGPNTRAVVREPKWLEIYGLKLVDLVVPPMTHRGQSFADFATTHHNASRLDETVFYTDEGSYLGIVGLASLTLLAAASVLAVLRRRANDVPREAWQALWIVLFFLSGGLNPIVGSLGFTLFRSGCRYSVVLLAIALLYAAQRLSGWETRLVTQSPNHRARWFFGAAAAASALLIFWDQTPRPPTPATVATITQQVESDRKFVAAMENALPRGAMVFQLPIMEYPESPMSHMPPYDHFRPYLYSKTLRFSFGSVKGRDKWQQELDAMTPSQRIEKIKSLGFSAIYLNRNAFSDRGNILEDLLKRLGYERPPIQSERGDLACFVLQRD